MLADIEAIGIAELDAAEGPRTTHVHRRHVESLYVLEGELTLTVDGTELRAESGSWIQVPPGVPHAVDGVGRYLDLHSPSCDLGRSDEDVP